MSDKAPVHGSKGVYLGGDWVDIEECAKWADGAPGGCTGKCNKCGPPKRTANSDIYDVVIIGAGCVGACIARELSKYQLQVALVDKADDVTQGATKGNSGIVHAGYDDKPGSVRAKFCWPGNQMFPDLDRDLKFGYLRNGSLVVAKGPEEEAVLQELYDRGQQNGVERLRIIGRDELRSMEPHVHPDATAALHSPDAGTVTPYEFAIAVAENAADNGVDVRLNLEVTDIVANDDGWIVRGQSTSSGAAKGSVLVPTVGIVVALAFWAVGLFFGGEGSPILAAISFVAGAAILGGSGLAGVKSRSSKPTSVSLRTKCVVNAAGTGSDRIARLVGDDSFTIKPRVGEYILLHKNQGHLAKSTLFPCPGKMGKGVLVQTTLWGNLILGPTARDRHDPETEKATKEDIMRSILAKCKELVPAFDASDVIHSFSGDRAKSSRGDWIVEECKVAPRFIHAAGIDSPGLAGSPAIAMEVTRLLESHLTMTPDPTFNPKRRGIIVPKHGWRNLKLGDADPKRNVVCKCEKVTEQEIVDAIHRSIPITSTQAIRKRTRAGMGHCQSDPTNITPSCEERVAAIIARETNVPVGAVGRRPWPATSLFPQRWMTDDQKKAVGALAD